MSKRNRNKNPWLSRRPETPAAAATGPRTPEGKAISSQNSLLHGMSGAHVVLPHEDAAEFDRLLLDMARAFRPQSAPERALVRHAAESQWLVQRGYRLETALMTLIAAGEDAKPATPDQRIAAYILSKSGDAIAKILRYITSAERAYYRALKELKEIAASRAETQVFSESYSEEQFVSQNASIAPQFVSQNSEPGPAPKPETPLLSDVAAA